MNYKVIEIRNPRATEQPGKYYARLINGSSINLEDFATRITATCTVTRHDCLAVLSALQEQIIYALQEGKLVHLGDVGNFRVSAKGSGSDTEKDYNISYLKKLKVVFTPNVTLKNALSLQNKAITFQRVKNVADVTETEKNQD